MSCIRVFVVTVLLLVGAFSSTAFAEAKAYEVVKYRGEAGGVSFALDYGDGYIEASEMRIIEKGKTTRFMLDTSGEMMHFVPDKKDGTDRRIVLKLGIDEAPGNKIEGTYAAAGKTIKFTLRRK